MLPEVCHLLLLKTPPPQCPPGSPRGTQGAPRRVSSPQKSPAEHPQVLPDPLAGGCGGRQLASWLRRTHRSAPTARVLWVTAAGSEP